MLKAILLSALLLLAPPTYSQIKVIKFNELNEFLTGPEGDKVKVINFWATRCGPCIKELPYFEEVSRKYPDDKVDSRGAHGEPGFRGPVR